MPRLKMRKGEKKEGEKVGRLDRIRKSEVGSGNSEGGILKWEVGIRKSEKKEGGIIGSRKDGSAASSQILLLLIEKTERSDIHKSSIFNLQSSIPVWVLSLHCGQHDHSHYHQE